MLLSSSETSFVSSETDACSPSFDTLVHLNKTEFSSSLSRDSSDLFSFISSFSSVAAPIIFGMSNTGVSGE